MTDWKREALLVMTIAIMSMNEPPEFMKKPSNAPYVWAVVMILLLASALCMGVIMARPAFDPLLIIVTIFGILVPTTGTILTYMKSEQTHLSVNSRLTEFMKEAKENAWFKGAEEGAAKEQARVVVVPPAPPIVAVVPPSVAQLPPVVAHMEVEHMDVKKKVEGKE